MGAIKVVVRQVVKIKVVVAKCKRGLIAVRKQSVSSIRLQILIRVSTDCNKDKKQELKSEDTPE